jgi:hypothetical protein
MCKYPQCPGTDKHADAVARGSDLRDGNPVCGQCVVIFARRRDDGGPIRIIWL